MNNLDLKILKAVLMMRRLATKRNFTYSQTKDEMLEEQKGYKKIPGYIEGMDEWIDSLREELGKTQEQIKEENERQLDLMAEHDWEMAQQDMEFLRNERDEWDDLWDDRARSVGAIRF